MAHLHQQIRDAMITALTGLTSTGSRVFANRVYPLTAADLPAIRIYTEEEEAEQIGLMGQWRQRGLSISVEACAKANTALDNTLDQIGLEIEKAIAGGITVSGKTLYPEYTGMQMDLEDLDQPIGVKRHRFRLSFNAASAHPETL